MISPSSPTFKSITWQLSIGWSLITSSLSDLNMMVGWVGLSAETNVPFSGVIVNRLAAFGFAESQSFLMKLKR
jgi:hypothetical protein